MSDDWSGGLSGGWRVLGAAGLGGEQLGQQLRRWLPDRSEGVALEPKIEQSKRISSSKAFRMRSLIIRQDVMRRERDRAVTSRQSKVLGWTRLYVFEELLARDRVVHSVDVEVRRDWGLERDGHVSHGARELTRCTSDLLGERVLWEDAGDQLKHRGLGAVRELDEGFGGVFERGLGEGEEK